jgi:apolipoprotein D and lipocalin family protein
VLAGISSVAPFGSALAMLAPLFVRNPGSDIRTAARVDLPRFMGDWYVIASIPTRFERDAVNARTHYSIDSDGLIEANYRFRKGGADGKEWTIRRSGIVRDMRSNAIWDLRLASPIAADYRIIHVDEKYGQAVVGRNRRDYAWILARAPEISSRCLFQHVRRLREQGYDSARLRTIPQHWP